MGPLVGLTQPEENLIPRLLSIKPNPNPNLFQFRNKIFSYSPTLSLPGLNQRKMRLPSYFAEKKGTIGTSNIWAKMPSQHRMTELRNSGTNLEKFPQ